MQRDTLLLQPARLDFEQLVHEEGHFYSWDSVHSLYHSSFDHVPHGPGSRMQLQYAAELAQPESEPVGVVMQVMSVVPAAAALCQAGREWHWLEVVAWQCYLHDVQPEETTPRVMLRSPRNLHLTLTLAERVCLDLYRTEYTDHVVYLLNLREWDLLLAASKKLELELDLFMDGRSQHFDDPTFSEAQLELYYEVQQTGSWAAFAMSQASEAVAVVRHEVEPQKLSLEVVAEEQAEEEAGK